jgi:mono/diheme cytochrome c family protein
MLNAIYRFFQDIGYSHPLHPTQVNMPIGLVVGAFFLALFAIRSRNADLGTCSRSCLLLALLFMIPTGLAGLMDVQYYYSGVMLTPVKWKIGLAGLLFVLLLTALFTGRRKEGGGKAFFALCGLALINVIALGYLGGNLVFSGRTPPAPKEYAAGRELFRSHCSGCHPYGANAVDASHHLWGSGRLTNILTFTAWIRSPMAPMPSFGEDRISEPEARALLSYLKFVLEKVPEREEAEHEGGRTSLIID